jgi:WD40 repeat protein
MDFDVWTESVDWNPNGTQFAVGLQNGTINIYNSSTYQLELSINATYYPTGGIVPKWNPNGSLIAGGGCDNYLYIFNAVTGKQLKKFFMNYGCVVQSGLAWSPDGKFLANANARSNLTQIWNIETYKKVTEFGPDNGTMVSLAYGVAWSPDGARLFTSSRFLEVRYTSNWTTISSIKTDFNVSCALSPDGKFLAVFWMPGIISIYNTWDMSLYRNISINGDVVDSVAWSPDGTKIVGGNFEWNESEAWIWDVAKGTPVATLSGKEVGFNEVAWSRDGKFIAVVTAEINGNRGNLKIWGEVSSVVRLISFSCDKSELEIGEDLSCTATIRNYGSLDGTNQSLRFYMDSVSLSERLFNITKGGTVEQTLELRISNETKLGQHILKARLNSDEKEFLVMVRAKPVIRKPNIYIKDITADRKVVTVGQTVTITTILGNNGTADSPDTLCTLYHGSDELNSTRLMVKQNSTESYLFKLDTKDLEPGDYTIKAVTGDKSKDVTITIRQKVGTTVIPDVFCIGLILMMIILIVIIVLYSRKKRAR